MNGESVGGAAAQDTESMLELLQAMRRHLDRGIDRDASVSFDEHSVHLWKRSPEGERAPQATFAWSSVVRICFKDSGPLASDLLFVSTRNPRSALVVPLEVEGGGELWRHLPARGLFPGWLHERATLATDGGFYCWPPLARPGAARPRSGTGCPGSLT